MEKLLILMIVVMLLVLIKVLKQDMLSPASINLCWNAFFLLGAIVIFGEGIDWKYEGIWWIVASCGGCLIGQFIGSAISLRDVGQRYGTMIGKRNYAYLMLVGIILLGLFNPLIYLNAFGYSVSDIFNIHALLQLNTEVAYDRYYAHRFNAPSIMTVLSIIIYMGALIGGYTFVIAKKAAGKIISLLTMIPILMLAIITNAKVGVIACVFLWIIGWCVHSLNIKRDGDLLSKKIIWIGICIAVLGIIFLDLTMLLRIGSIDHETQLIVNQKLQEYAFGQVQAFSLWFHKRGNESLELGTNTYMFITNWLGLTARKQGVYDLMPGVASNIYTQNRGIIADFGVIGGLVYWTFVGFVSGVVYKKVKSGSHNCILSKVLLSAIYFMILYGFIISPWIYSSYVLAFVGYAIFLVILNKFKFSFKR